MRGPLESLISLAQQKLSQKRFPHRFFAEQWRVFTNARLMPDHSKIHRLQCSLCKVFCLCSLVAKKQPLTHPLPIKNNRKCYPLG
jgi:hypothetical protein